MPSGSHGGSIGSHSSGGSSYGGGSSYSGGSDYGGGYGGGGHIHHRHIRFYRRGGIYFYTQRDFTAIILVLFAIISSILFFTIAISNYYASVMTVKKIETDYNYYQQMILNAENDTEYQTIAEVKDHFYNMNADKWYFTYTFYTDNSQEVEGYTYSIYEYTDLISNFAIGTDITIAVNMREITEDTDSIPMAYKDTTLSQDGEYNLAIKDKNSKLLGIFGIAFMIIMFVAVEILLIKRIKKETEESQKEIEKVEKQAEVKRCKYCQSIIKDNKTNCSNCGAKF